MSEAAVGCDRWWKAKCSLSPERGDWIQSPRSSGRAPVAALQWPRFSGRASVAALQWPRFSGRAPVAALQWPRFSGRAFCAATGL